MRAYAVELLMNRENWWKARNGSSYCNDGKKKRMKKGCRKTINSGQGKREKGQMENSTKKVAPLI